MDRKIYFIAHNKKACIDSRAISDKANASIASSGISGDKHRVQDLLNELCSAEAQAVYGLYVEQSVNLYIEEYGD